MKRLLLYSLALCVAVLQGMGAVYVENLRDLFDVNVSGVVNGNTITYTNGIWYASIAGTGSGGAPTNTVTVTNGVAQYLAKFTDTTNITAGPVQITSTTNAVLTGGFLAYSGQFTNGGTFGPLVTTGTNGTFTGTFNADGGVLTNGGTFGPLVTTGTNGTFTGGFRADYGVFTNNAYVGASSIFAFTGRSTIGSGADGRLAITKSDSSAATALTFGQEASTNARIKHVPGSNPQIQVRTGDDANYADFYASNVVASANVTAIASGGSVAAAANGYLYFNGRAYLQSQEASGGGLTLSSPTGDPTRLRIDGTAVTLTDAAATDVLRLAVATNTVAGMKVHYTVRAVDAAYAQQAESGEVELTAVNVDGTFTITVTEHDSQQALSSGTLSTTWTCTEDAANVLYLKLNADTSLTPTAMSVITEIQNSYGAITML